MKNTETQTEEIWELKNKLQRRLVRQQNEYRIPRRVQVDTLTRRKICITYQQKNILPNTYHSRHRREHKYTQRRQRKGNSPSEHCKQNFNVQENTKANINRKVHLKHITTNSTVSTITQGEHNNYFSWQRQQNSSDVQRSVHTKN